eukprot:6869923-Pyramimonas_sp.AAC.1
MSERLGVAPGGGGVLFGERAGRGRDDCEAGAGGAGPHALPRAPRHHEPLPLPQHHRRGVELNLTTSEMHT